MESFRPMSWKSLSFLGPNEHWRARGDIALVGAKVVMGRLASAYQDAGFGFEKC